MPVFKCLTSSRQKQNITLELWQPLNTYVPGDTLRGTVTFTKDVRTIFLMLDGQVEIEINPTESAEYCYHRPSFLHEMKRVSIPPGCERYEWEFQIPEKITSLVHTTNFDYKYQNPDWLATEQKPRQLPPTFHDYNRSPRAACDVDYWITAVGPRTRADDPSLFEMNFEDIDIKAFWMQSARDEHDMLPLHLDIGYTFDSFWLWHNPESPIFVESFPYIDVYALESEPPEYILPIETLPRNAIPPIQSTPPLGTSQIQQIMCRVELNVPNVLTVGDYINATLSIHPQCRAENVEFSLPVLENIKITLEADTLVHGTVIPYRLKGKRRGLRRILKRLPPSKDSSKHVHWKHMVFRESQNEARGVEAHAWRIVQPASSETVPGSPSGGARLATFTSDQESPTFEQSTIYDLTTTTRLNLRTTPTFVTICSARVYFLRVSVTLKSRESKKVVDVVSPVIILPRPLRNKGQRRQEGEIVPGPMMQRTETEEELDIRRGRGICKLDPDHIQMLKGLAETEVEEDLDSCGYDDDGDSGRGSSMRRSQPLDRLSDFSGRPVKHSVMW
jgi:hypothetical protein